MKERPILFGAPMVRAILAGTKLQTRRVVRKQFAPDALVAEVGATSPEGWQVSGHSGIWWDDAESSIDNAVRCPFGMPGDRLWVRESFCDARAGGTGRVLYRATGDFACGWKPSLHMPRALSRITLEVTGVRVERLQDIREDDARAEGVRDWAGEQDTPVRDMVEARLQFRQLWAQINGPDSWDADPWVWVVEFRRV